MVDVRRKARSMEVFDPCNAECEIWGKTGDLKLATTTAAPHTMRLLMRHAR